MKDSPSENNRKAGGGMDGGIIPLWKERGVYSQRYITQIRRLLDIKKVGHSGTLDPDVDGVLPIAFGYGTKVLEYMLDSDKKYQGTVTLGYSTSTEDASGDRVESTELQLDDLDNEKIDDILSSFLGEIEQTPPMYSAIRVDGVRLYELARQNIIIDRPSRKVTIFHLKRTSPLEYDKENKTFTFSFDVHCSKGTYIRTLAVDIGKAMNIPAHMSSLTRIESAGIRADKTYKMEDLIQAKESGHLEDLILPIEDFLTSFDSVEVSQDLSQRIKHGAQLNMNNFTDKKPDFPALLTYNKRALAIYEENPNKPGWIKPLKMIRN